MTKAEARQWVDGLGLPEAQAQAARRTIGRATTSENIEISIRFTGNLLITRTRPGKTGYPVFEDRISREGNKRVVQKAYDDAGNLIHHDPKGGHAMSLGVETAHDVIRQVIRGERPWTDLSGVGIEVRLDGSRCAIDNPARLTASADLQDLARGLLTHLADPSGLRAWAFVLQSESFVDWGNAEHDSAWEPLWDAVWKASFGDPIPEEAIKTAEKVVQAKGSHP
jgi:hypothetical protein